MAIVTEWLRGNIIGWRPLKSSEELKSKKLKLINEGQKRCERAGRVHQSLWLQWFDVIPQMWALGKTKQQQSTALKIRHRELRATDPITKPIDVSENSLKGSKELKNLELATMSSYKDFISRILQRTSSVGFLAMIGVGQSALGPQRNFGPWAQRAESLSSAGENVSWI